MPKSADGAFLEAIDVNRKSIALLRVQIWSAYRLIPTPIISLTQIFLDASIGMGSEIPGNEKDVENEAQLAK